jgi:NitT/TauT family transport system substrate-binding protein
MIPVGPLQGGEIDAMSNLDPVIAQLEFEGEIKVLLDTRTEAGTRELF